MTDIKATAIFDTLARPLTEAAKAVTQLMVKKGFHPACEQCGGTARVDVSPNIIDMCDDCMGSGSRRTVKEQHADFPCMIALAHSELSEALEAARRADTGMTLSESTGVSDELADVVIRVLNIAGALQIDIGEAVSFKMRVNAGRPHKHGKNY